MDKNSKRLTFGATDTAILEQVEQQCGRHVRSLYPVEKEYAFSKSALHLSSCLTRVLEGTLVTHVPLDAWAFILRNQGRELYDEQAANYESHCVSWIKGRLAFTTQQEAVPPQPFPSFPLWAGREFVLGSTLKKYVVRAWYLAKRDEERNIELQQVGVKGGIVSCDHTHSVVKNIHNSKKKVAVVKAVWDVCNNTTGETVSSVCVASTAAGAYAHAANSLVLARKQTISVCFTDNWPTSEEVYKALWDISHGRLDIFHWMCRLSKLLRDTHCDYYRALAAMSQCVYHWDEDDITAVLQALEDGLLNNKKHSPRELKEMMDDGTFYRRYSEFIQKRVWAKGTIVRKMEEWKRDYATKVDPKTGWELARTGFDEVFALELGRVGDLVEVEGIEHNVELRGKPKAKHKLRRWRSVFGAKVETGHLPLKHYANQGSHPKLFQCFTMEGLCRTNADRREDSKQLVDTDGDDSRRQETRVAHYRPWIQRERNQLCEKLGMPEPYPEVGTARPADNGERFLYEYHVQQQERDLEHGGYMQTPEEIIDAGGCTCRECTEIRKIEATATAATSSSNTAAYPEPPPNRRRFSRRAHAPLVALPPGGGDDGSGGGSDDDNGGGGGTKNEAAAPAAIAAAAPSISTASSAAAATPSISAASLAATAPSISAASSAAATAPSISAASLAATAPSISAASLAATAPSISAASLAAAAPSISATPLPLLVPTLSLQQMQFLQMQMVLRMQQQQQQQASSSSSSSFAWPLLPLPQQEQQQQQQQQASSSSSSSSSASLSASLSSAGSGKKRKVRASKCTCGAWEKTKEMRSGKSGRGGRNERHEPDCPAKTQP